MKIHLLNDSKQGLGGGWTFMGNFAKGLKQFPEHQIVNSIEESDLCFVSGATMVTRQTIDRVQELGKKLVTRLDNVPRNSRNRNTGTSRLKEFAERADGVVWQCNWAKEWLGGSFIKPKKETIIYNGVDTDIFKPDGEKRNFRDNPEQKIYLFSRFSRDETKNWEVAWYDFQREHLKNNNIKLIIVGSFSQEQMDYNFDFFQGEKIQYLGVIDNPNEMAKILRGCDYFMATYFNDAYSNTYLEALMCGVNPHSVSWTGGTPELMTNAAMRTDKSNGLKRMVGDYLDFFATL